MSATWPLVVFVGAATLDVVVRVSRYPEPDERTVAEELVHAGGGPAATAAVAAARLGVPSAFVGAVGDDAEGERIVDDLRDEGVDVSAVTTASGAESGAGVGIVDAARGTRAICSRPAPPPDFAGAGALLEHATWVHTDHIGYPAMDSYLRSKPAESGPRLSVDAGNPVPGLTLEAVDLYVPTASALRRRYALDDIAAALDCALAEGARAVVATRGANGAVAAAAGGQRCAVAGRAVQMRSTLGAGDVFHGALLAALTRGGRLDDALAYANTVAALSCRGLDGRSAIPTGEQAARAVVGASAAESTPSPKESA